MADTPSYKGYVPADLQKTESSAASAAATTPAGSYDKIIRLPLQKDKKYRFWFTYLYEDEETKKITEGPRSPIVELGFDIPNLTRPVLNLALTQSYRAYGVKFDVDPLSVQEDIVVFESLSADFANPYIVYVGTSNNITIQTGSTAQRWVKVVVRDKWLDTNRSESAILTVTPLNPDPDTTFTVENPTTTSASAAIDPKDLSGFSLVSTITWSVSTDLKTAGYALRWSTTNPATGIPLWEYASVTGRTTNTFTATGLIPNTTYYYQVAATTPYDVVSWTGAASGTFIASDAAGTAAGALARLKSFIAIGGATGDLFKLGTGISQGINLSTVPIATPTLTDGTYNGIILNKSTTNVGNNFWLTTGQFRVGNSTEFLYWNGTDLNLTGNIEATGGKFTGNVQLAIPTGGTTSGSLYAGASATSGARLRLNNLGLFAYDGLSADATVSITNDGVIDARKGYIGGWTVSGTAQTTGTISKNGTILDSNGNITLGDATGTLASIVRLSSSDATFRLWVGSQTASNAPFKVDKTGKLTATGAEISGTLVITAGATKTAIDNAAAAASTADGKATAAAATATTANSTATAANTAATNAAALAATKLTKSANTIADSSNNITGINANGITVFSNGASPTSVPTTGARVVMNSAGIAAYNSSNVATFSLNATNGNAMFKGDLTGASGTFSGTLSGATITGGSINIDGGTGTVLDDGDGGPNTVLSTTTNAFSTLYSRAGTPSLGLNAIAFISVNTGGWTSSCYPYTDGAVDLGIKRSATGAYATYRWRNARLTNSLIMGGDGSTDAPGTAAANPKTALYGDGGIYANTLSAGGGGSTGTAIIQNSSGYLKVSGSSRRFKENIYSLSKDGYLDALMNVNPVNFNYIGEDEVVSGLIAEELDEIDKFKGVVNYDLEGDPISIAYDRMSALLVLAIKEIKDKLDLIEQRLDALEG